MVTEVKTAEELILKWCGFNNIEKAKNDDGTREWRNRLGKNISLRLPLDMNFFFQYVVPKLNRFTIDDTNRFENEWQKAFIVKLKLPHSAPVSAMAKDPNEAWQSALIKLIEVQE